MAWQTTIKTHQKVVHNPPHDCPPKTAPLLPLIASLSWIVESDHLHVFL